MRLRKPCQHGFYEEHIDWYGTAGICPGGEFLTVSDVLAEVSDADLQEEWVRRVGRR